jgi:hypothetical protein
MHIVCLAQFGLERVAFNLVVVGSNPTADTWFRDVNGITYLAHNRWVIPGSNPGEITGPDS